MLKFELEQGSLFINIENNEAIMTGPAEISFYGSIGNLKNMKKNNINIINLGCRLNIYEGEVIKSLTKQNNLENYTIINSCSVTEKAEKKVQYEIRKSKKKFPQKKIVVTGCACTN